MNEDYRGITRALSVLTELNRVNGSTVTALGQATSISRPALYRILNVLVAAGYVRRRDDDRTYLLTSKVKTLSDGFRSDTSLYEAAAPVLDKLQREVIWPTDLAVYRGNWLELLETTRRQSPFTIDDLVAGGQLSSVFTTALGIAYLAHARSAERDAILASYAADPGPAGNQFFSNPTFTEDFLAKVRSEGYAWRYRGTVKETGTIAVPVLKDGFAIASIGITFIAAAMSVTDAVKRYLPLLQNSSREIEEALVQLG